LLKWDRFTLNQDQNDQRPILHTTWYTFHQRFSKNAPFLADRTNGRATGTVLRLSVCRLWRYLLWINSAS